LVREEFCRLGKEDGEEEERWTLEVRKSYATVCSKSGSAHQHDVGKDVG
jgi:hypothetical protein